MADALHAERKRVVDAAHIRLFRAVEAGVIRLQPFCRRQRLIDKLPVGRPRRENDVLIDLDERRDAVGIQLRADEPQQNAHGQLGACAVPGGVKRQKAEIQQQNQQAGPDGDAFVDIVEGLSFRLRVEDHDQHKQPCARDRGNRIAVFDMAERVVSHHEQEGAQDEGIAVVEPVRILEAVPDEIQRRDVHAHREEKKHGGGTDLFADADVPVGEEQRHQQQCQRAGEQRRQPLRPAGIICAEQELWNQLQKVELRFRREARVGEVHLAQRQRIIRRNQHEGRDPGRQNRKSGKQHSFFQEEPAAALAARPRREPDIEEIRRRVDGDHIADVKVRDENKRQHRRIEQVFVFLDQPLHAQHDQRQTDHRVQPHRIHLLHDHIRHQRIHAGNDQNAVGLAAARRLEIIGERQRRAPRPKERRRQQRLRDERLREKQIDNHERAAHVVGVQPERLAAERAAPAVNQAAVAEDCVAEALIIVDILCIQVEHQQRVAAEWEDLKRDVAKLQHSHRQKKRQQVQRSVLFVLSKHQPVAQAAFPPGRPCFLRRFLGRCLSGLCRFNPFHAVTPSLPAERDRRTLSVRKRYTAGGFSVLRRCGRHNSPECRGRP